MTHTLLTLQQISDAHLQFLRIEGLEHIGIGSVAQSLQAIGVGTLGRDHDDGDMGEHLRLTHKPTEGLPVHARHHQVGDNDVGHLFGGHCQSFLSIVRHEQTVVLFQTNLHIVRHVGIVFYDQDSRTVTSSRSVLAGGHARRFRFSQGREMSAMRRQCYLESSASAHLALHRCIATKRLGNLPDERQTYSRSAAMLGFIALPKQIEHVLLFLSTDATTVISDGQHRQVRLYIERYRHMSAFGGKLDSVVYQVVDDLLQVLGHKIGFRHLILMTVGKHNVLIAGHVLEAVYQNRHVLDDISTAPFGL